MKIAILGGSFNPIHLGHLALAEKAYKEFGFNKIAIVPAFISPFKQNPTNYLADYADKNLDKIKMPTVKERVEMIELAIKDKPYLYCEKYELEKKGVSYTIDTVNYFYKNYPDLEKPPALIIGDDLADSFFKWKNAEEILQKTKLIIARRIIPQNEKIKKTQEQSVNKNKLQNSILKNLEHFSFTELHNSILPISSSQIRLAILEKKKFSSLLPKAVYDYIIEKKLYQEI